MRSENTSKPREHGFRHIKDWNFIGRVVRTLFAPFWQGCSQGCSHPDSQGCSHPNIETVHRTLLHRSSLIKTSDTAVADASAFWH